MLIFEISFTESTISSNINFTMQCFKIMEQNILDTSAGKQLS
jgi:hypothetical protein